MKTDCSYDEAVIDMLRRDPGFVEDYFAAALDEAEEPGGDVALLAALRQIAEAQSGGIALHPGYAGLPYPRFCFLLQELLNGQSPV